MKNRKSKKLLSPLLSVSTAEEAFGPLFAALDLVPRRVVNLGADEVCGSWNLVRETSDGIILRDGVNHWMEETFWVARRSPGCSFALRFRGQEFEFVRVLARRGHISKPCSKEKAG